MADKVLIIDDMELNRDMLSVILEGEYEIEVAEDGDLGIQKLKVNKDEIVGVLLDLNMPNKNGYDVLSFMQQEKMIDRIPVLIISAESSSEAENRCLSMGVSDFIRKPFDSATVQRRVRNVVELFLHRNALESKVTSQMRTLQRQNELLEAQALKLRENNEKIIDVLGEIVEGRSLESGQHIKCVKVFTEILAKWVAKIYPEYHLTPEKIRIIVAASALHDIGKIAIADNVLLKPGKLTIEEFEYMKTHTTRGCEMLERITNVWDEVYSKASYEICRHHHERYDGRGYPDGLKGEEIPISAQLVSIADVYDALVSKRVYKGAFSKDEAFQMIMKGDCGIFNPKLLECFHEAKAEFEALADKSHQAEKVA